MRTRESGQLEAEILRILRTQEAPLSAREIRAAVVGRQPAYTTVMTALGRLEKKGEVVRAAESPRKVRFRAAHSGDEHASRTMLSALEESGDREAALLRFAGHLTDEDAELLREAIRPRRRGKAG
ncbi:Transcriptional regulator, MecI family [Gulosibacter sp. 10]|nr:Transcriptional regulator, MecI family [Gulosibacter sp. 10]